MISKIKAWVFVYLIRPFLKKNDGGVMRCPVCFCYLQWYDSHGWLHMLDGDADCYGALSYGKGPHK